MMLEIFDVEHGACALLTADNRNRFMLDCGHNASTSWKPGEHLRGLGATQLEMLAITNYDEDHASGANDLFDRINVQWLWRNKSVSSKEIKSLKSEDSMGAGIDRLFKEIDGRFSGPKTTAEPPPFDGLIERAAFHHSYPDFEDENNLSMVVFLNCAGKGVLFPGDLEEDGWLKHLENSDFRAMLSKVRVLVASHHGRESGCCDEAMQLMTDLNYVVISDKGYMYNTQLTVPYYQQFAKGGPFRGKQRKVLTTRSDGLITFNFEYNRWFPF